MTHTRESLERHYERQFEAWRTGRLPLTLDAVSKGFLALARSQAKLRTERQRELNEAIAAGDAAAEARIRFGFILVRRMGLKIFDELCGLRIKTIRETVAAGQPLPDQTETDERMRAAFATLERALA